MDFNWSSFFVMCSISKHYWGIMINKITRIWRIEENDNPSHPWPKQKEKNPDQPALK